MENIEDRLKLLSRWREDVTFFLLDYDTKEVIYERNGDILRTIGSMTKLMSAYVLLEEKLTTPEAWEQMITIDSECSVMANNIDLSAYEQFKEGEKRSARELLSLCLVPSGCASTLALAKHFYGTEEAFIERMHEHSRKIDINATFCDCYGTHPGDKCSARDLSKLAYNLIDRHPEILSITSMHAVPLHGTDYINTSRLIRDGLVPGMDGLKSGTTLVSGNCYIGTAKRDGHRYISVVMNAQTTDEQHAETKALLEYGLSLKNE